jgi:2-polyprenyl-3-methyl-5-hydroxy-6-metoxy-1,4-benzoquinol methylase
VPATAPLTTPGWYRALLRLEELALRLTISRKLRARDANVPLGGAANRVRHPTLGHVAAERLIPGEDGSAVEFEHHIARYTWAFRFAEGKHAIDVGCGAGYGSFLLSWVADEVDGVDRDPTAIAVARAKFQGPRYSVVDGTTDQLPTGDVATCFEVLEHVDDPAALCRELLAHAPEVLVSYPNPFAAGPHLNPHHVVDWPLGVLKQALRAAGAGEIGVYHQRIGSPQIRRGGPPWSAVWILHVRRDGTADAGGAVS